MPAREPEREQDVVQVLAVGAYRELADLVAKGCLVPTGAGGRSSSYAVRWEETPANDLA